MLKELPFSQLAKPIAERLNYFIREALHERGKVMVLDVSKEELWDTYLESFPKEVNVIFRERRIYDGSYDKNYIRVIGGIVLLKDSGVEYLWDLELPGYFNDVSKAMMELLEGRDILAPFYVRERTAGHLPNLDSRNPEITWEHFYHDFRRVDEGIDTKLSEYNAAYNVTLRSLKEFTEEALTTVEELLNDNVLYRGNEYIARFKEFMKLRVEYLAAEAEGKSNFFISNVVSKYGRRMAIRNTALGTILDDLSVGMDVEDAVKRYEKITAPENYSRPTAIVTKAMIERAGEKIKELGLENSVRRRAFTETDLTPYLEHAHYAKPAVVKPKAVDVFEILADEAKHPAKFDRKSVEEISFNQLVEFGKAGASFEVLFEKANQGNLVALTTSKDAVEEKLLNWDNQVGWTYNGGVADAIKMRVKEAGGNVDSRFRMSLSWHNGEDLDLHLVTPRGEVCFPVNSRRDSGFVLDVDMNGIDKYDSENPVENIYLDDEDKLISGKYMLFVHNYPHRILTHPVKQEAVVQVELDGVTTEVSVPELNKNDICRILEFHLEGGSKDFEIQYLRAVNAAEGKLGDTVWGIEENCFHPVDYILPTPNNWGGESGSKQDHKLFIIKACVPSEDIRGFFNEQFTPVVKEHRKVLEIVGNRSMVTPVEDQIAGLGFNVSGGVSPIVKIIERNGRQQVVKVKF